MKQRQEEIALNVGRFEQLEAVYDSDIQRLYAIEEAGFLLSLGGDRDCPLCGASPEHQKIAHGLAEIEQAQEAATVEIQKIREQSDELDATLVDLQAKAVAIRNRLIRSESELEDVDAQLDALAPMASDARTRVNEISKVRDRA
jgi:septal ring factor EnvC (AmiA/AmiB activator)